MTVAQGKPRPAVIIQSSVVATPGSLIICPLTSFLIEAPIYRPTILPTPANGLKMPSQLMVDRITFAREERIANVIGSLDADDLERLDLTLVILLDLGG
ncbi:type II toxin-antitoxin system PemK/MazF family toxin [Sphingomonas bacterium]|uniref:type II toxin-antitoxin system PemK/MazF family toxin n=1 Tax=Sphingomonas bacterium TaxID=1895847 RepID=UPI0015766540|nr:type II toxin-antitoxin system PemK/MazF family toxin [Sphingomonas bacterium]